MRTKMAIRESRKILSHYEKCINKHLESYVFGVISTDLLVKRKNKLLSLKCLYLLIYKRKCKTKIVLQPNQILKSLAFHK